MADMETRGMIERVAAAMFAKDRGGDWAMAPEITRNMFRMFARAAIEAMREPTEAQMQVFRQFFGFNPFVKDGGPADRLFAGAYKASFDAALSPKEPHQSDMMVEFDRLCTEFDEGHAKFMHYARQGRWEEARAINAAMKILLERQKEIEAEMSSALKEDGQ